MDTYCIYLWGTCDVQMFLDYSKMENHYSPGKII